MNTYRILPVLLLLLSCSSRYSQTETTRSEIDDSYSTSTTLPVGVDAGDKLSYASRAATEGRWKESVRAYREVYDDKKASDEDRSRALLGLGDVLASPLNPYRDFDRSLHYLDKIDAEFPESSIRAKAEKKIESVRIMIEEVENVTRD